ncbi:hypothetical protein Nmel_012060 [Mimus melanotis]
MGPPMAGIWDTQLGKEHWEGSHLHCPRRWNAGQPPPSPWLSVGRELWRGGIGHGQRDVCLSAPQPPQLTHCKAPQIPARIQVYPNPHTAASSSTPSPLLSSQCLLYWHCRY